MKLSLNDFSIGTALTIAVGVVLAGFLGKMIQPKVS